MIAIIDYGMGNIHSVKKAVESFGVSTQVMNNPRDIKNADKVILPGVGAFGDAMAELDKQGLTESIKEHISKKKIFLGICLGMHMLFSYSEESKGCRGLGIFADTVKRFPHIERLKVPHMGWNQLAIKNPACPLLKDIPDGSYVYFCHSFYAAPQTTAIRAATTDYGLEFTSIIYDNNVYGVQFHPEKSQEIGLKILKNFIAM